MLPSNMEIEKGPLPQSKKRGVFYGYWILVIAFLCVFVFSGCSVGVFSLFVQPLQADFGWGRGEIMVAFSILFIVTGVVAPLIGNIIDRHGVKGVISVGAFAAAIGFISLYFLANLWHFYGAYMVIGIGMAAVGQVPASTLVSNWFKKRRGTAIGIMSTGIGAGILVLAPVIGGYIIPNLGWRVAYLALALVASILIPLALFVVKNKPAEMGLYPDGAENSDTPIGARVERGASVKINPKMALGTSAFWLIAVSFFISGFSSLGVNQSQVPYLQDIGFSVAAASSSLTILGFGSAVGKFTFGWLCDQIQAKYACAISLGLLVVGTIILMKVQPASSLAIIWLYAIILGLGSGGWLPTMSMLINVNFGLGAYGTIFGMITLVQSLGGATGPLFAGYMYDNMNTYHWPFLLFLTLYPVAILAVLLVRHPGHRK